MVACELCTPPQQPTDSGRWSLQAPSPNTLAAWLGASSACRVTACEDDRIHATWAARVRSLHKDLSLAVHSQDFLHSHGSFSRVSFAVRLLGCLVTYMVACELVTPPQQLTDFGKWCLLAPSPNTLAAWLGASSACRITAFEDDRFHATGAARARSLHTDLSLDDNSKISCVLMALSLASASRYACLTLGRFSCAMSFLMHLSRLNGPIRCGTCWMWTWTLKRCKLQAFWTFLMKQVPQAPSVDCALSEEAAIAFMSSRLELRRRQALRAPRILGLRSIEFMQIYGYWLLRGCGFDFGWWILVTLCLAAVFVGTLCLWVWLIFFGHNRIYSTG